MFEKKKHFTSLNTKENILKKADSKRRIKCSPHGIFIKNLQSFLQWLHLFYLIHEYYLNSYVIYFLISRKYVNFLLKKQSHVIDENIPTCIWKYIGLILVYGLVWCEKKQYISSVWCETRISIHKSTMIIKCKNINNVLLL